MIRWKVRIRVGNIDSNVPELVFAHDLEGLIDSAAAEICCQSLSSCYDLLLCFGIVLLGKT